MSLLSLRLASSLAAVTLEIRFVSPATEAGTLGIQTKLPKSLPFSLVGAAIILAFYQRLRLKVNA